MDLIDKELEAKSIERDDEVSIQEVKPEPEPQPEPKRTKKQRSEKQKAAFERRDMLEQRN